MLCGTSPQVQTQDIQLDNLLSKFSLPDEFPEEKFVDNDITICSDCCIKLQRKNSIYCVCPNCGLEKKYETQYESYSNDITHSYNCSNNSHVLFKISGCTRTSRAQNNKLMGLTSEPSLLKEKRVLRIVKNRIYQVPDDHDSVPMDVIEAAAKTYSNLQHSDALVKRAGGLESVLSSLIAYKCVEFGVPRKPKDIIAAMNIRDHQLSQGNKILKKFLKIGSLELVDGHGEHTDFVDQYFEKLNIEKYDKYKPFVIDLINATNINKIKSTNNSARPTTRIAGSVYILCESLKIPNVTREDIAKKCNISKSTFMRFVDLVMDNKNKKCVKKIFKKYNIELNK